jgi:hypothetical protein
MQDHDLDDFGAFTDEEIAAIAAFLHEERETASPVVPDEPMLKRKRISIGTAQIISGEAILK